MANSIAPLTAAALNAPSSAATNAASAASGNGVLNQADFLKLLTAQVQYQNPLSPVDSSTFLGQLSQLSATTGMQQLNSSFSDLMLLQGLTQGSNLIGKTVSFVPNGANQPSSGVVNSFQIVGGKV